MRRSVRHRLSGLAFILAVLAASLGVFTHRMPTLDDLALVRFLAIGGTADDLCSTPDPHRLIADVGHLCAPAVQGPPIAPAVALLGLVAVSGRLRWRIAPVTRRAALRLTGPGNRGPPQPRR